MRPGALTAADARQLSSAATELQRGQAATALAIVRDVLTRSPESSDALHLLALSSKATGDRATAEKAFREASTRAPADANILNNYANFLLATGAARDAIPLYRRAVSAAPSHADAWMNLGLAHIELNEPTDAQAALNRATQLRPSRSAAWQAMGTARRMAGDLEGAEGALRRAVVADSHNGAAWTNLGVVRRLLGDPAEALRCYAQARGANFTGAELADAQASAHLDLGEANVALEQTRRLVAIYPHYPAGHSMLAQILWEHGEDLSPGEDAIAVFSEAAAKQPGNHPLRRELIRFLLDAGAPEKALAELDALQAAGGPALIASRARVLEMLGRTAEADELFRQSRPTMQRDAGFLSLYARHLLRTRQPDQAAAVASEALDADPSHQAALSYLGVAWRMMGDPREEWLCGYERFVRVVPVETPSGFASQSEFLAILEAALTELHVARREPVNQSVRGGSQTSGNLFGRPQPVLRAFRDAAAAAVARYVAELPEDASHPFLRRRSDRVRFVGSWSVRLRSSGRHANHFHQQGWISSAFYVALPPSVLHAPEGAHDGWIQFGQPPVDLGLDLAPRRVIQPEPGKLVLFPSYLWHGTLPFNDPEPRLTIAFDAVPMTGHAPS